jgi:hypothetical protein
MRRIARKDKEIMTTKVCTKCKIEKDISEFSPDKGSNDGFHSWCRHCKNYMINQNRYDKIGIPSLRSSYQFIESKTCTHCGINKPISEFYKCKSGIYSAYCKLCSNKHKQKCKNIIKEHHEILKDDPERLTTEFLVELTGCNCKRYNK